MVVAPSLRAAHTCDACGTLLCQEAVGHSVPADTLLQVDGEEVLLLSLCEGVTMEAHTVGGCQLHVHAGVGELHGIIAGLDRLVVMREDCACLLVIAHGQKGDVAEVADTCAAEVSVTKADNLIIAVMVA